MTLYLSNQLEILADYLKKNLLSASHPFVKRYLVVPSRAMKEWLTFYFAHDPTLNICMGISFLYLEEALTQFASLFYTTKEKERLQELALLLHIEEECQRPLAYCKNMASLFKRQSLYAERGSEGDFKENDLYKKIFSNYALESDFFNNLARKAGSSADYSLHIFGFDHIAPVHLNFLLRQSSLYFYNFSPCLEFWSDLLSDKEIKNFFQRKKLQADVRVEWENYLEERHPLLANLGKVGRQLAALFEESEVTTVENYEHKAIESLLLTLQSDLLHLTKTAMPKADDSIQIHSFSTRHSEVRALFYTLQTLMSEKNIEPSEVRVFAPDITQYTPFIRSYFGKELSSRIVDEPLPSSLDPVSAFQWLFELEKKRWSPESVMEILFHPLFKSAFREEEKELLRRWLEKEPIHFGYNLEHANWLLRQRHCDQCLDDGEKTWEAALRRQFLSYASETFASPFTLVEAPFLGELATVLQSLYNDLSAIHEENKECSLQEWVAHFSRLFTTYFQGEEIEKKLADFKEKSGHFIHTKYPFKRIFALVLDFLLKQKSSFDNEDYQAITFSTFLPGRVVPAKIIVLLGMNQDDFPRKEEIGALGQKKRGYPLREEVDRYLFLESLLMAKEYLIFSYQGSSPFDQSEKLPSSCLSELLFYLPKDLIRHPNLSFDPANFSTPSLLKGSSLSDYEICLFYHKKAAPQLFYTQPSIAAPPKDFFLPISELRTLLRNPLKFFFYKKFGFYLENNFSQEEFALSPLDRFHLRNRSFQEPLEVIFQELKVQGKMPFTGFKELFSHRLTQEHQKYLHFLKVMGLKNDEVRECDITHSLSYKSQNIHCTGKIAGVTPLGLLLFDKYSFSALVSRLADFLLLNTVQPSSQLLFVLENRVHKPLFTELTKLVKYYFLAQENPIPLLPDWLEPILAKEEKKLDQKIKAAFEEKNAAVVAAFQQIPKASAIIEQWEPLASSLFGELYHG